MMFRHNHLTDTSWRLLFFKVIQARAKNNRIPNSQQLMILQDWSERMGFIIELYKNE